MKKINTYIQEKLVITKDTKLVPQYNYHPKDRDELRKLVNKLIKERGDNANLNDINTSEITDMSFLFFDSDFNGDISKWDVSNVKNMYSMFAGSEFTGENGDISKWDVCKVKNMQYMFAKSKFTGKNSNISKWNVSKVENMSFMFADSKFMNKNGDISNWNVSNVMDMRDMFKDSPLEKNPPKWYKRK